MFEQAVIDSAPLRRSSRKAATLPISIALHFIALSGALFAAVWDVEFPLDAPPQIEELTRVEVPKPPAGRPPAQQKRSQPRPAVAPRPDVPPTTVPAEPPRVAEAVPAETTGAQIGSDEIGGIDPNGVAGGDPNSLSDEALQAEPPRQLHRTGGDVKPPVILARVEPVYPPLAVRMRLEGIAVVECIIDRDGNVQSVKSIHASHELFRGAAEAAVARWKFRPGTLNGAPVDVIFNLTVSFKLNG